MICAKCKATYHGKRKICQECKNPTPPKSTEDGSDDEDDFQEVDSSTDGVDTEEESDTTGGPTKMASTTASTTASTATTETPTSSSGSSPTYTSPSKRILSGKDTVDQMVGQLGPSMEELAGRVWVTDKVRTLEDDLKAELKELTNEIEDNEVIHGIQRSVSSVSIPKDATHFQRERELCIKRVLEVCEAQGLIAQADVMQEELNNATINEYTTDSLPLLLHQYFSDRIQQLVQCKHMHMLRWKRFCEHTSTIEALYPHYSWRLAHIMSEYNDCIARAQRLSVAREAHLAKAKTAAQAVQLDDLLIYLRFLVCHLHSIKRFNQFLKVVEWLPITHREDIRPDTEETTEDDASNMARIPARYQDDNSFIARPLSASSRPPSAQHPLQLSEPPQPPPLNPTLLTSNPASANQLSYAAAAAGGGIASDEENLALPLHRNDLESLRPLLNFFAHLYSVNVNVETLHTSADEMELYATVNRKFRQMYTRQEHLKTFKTYDRIEVGQENWGADHSMHALKQESNWLPFMRLRPHYDPSHERKMVELRSRDDIDELLRVQAKFLHVVDAERVQDALRDHAVMVRNPPTVNPVRVTSNRTSYHTTQIWKKIYTNPELHAKANEDDDMIMGEFDFDEKDVENVNLSKSRAQSARKRKDSYDYVDTVQLLGLDEGGTDSDDPASLQGAYLSFLQLRHLRIRDLQRTTLSILNYFRSVERTLTINDGGLSHESGKVSPTSSQNHRKTVGDGSMGTGGGLGSHQYIHNTPKDYKIAESEFMEFTDIENHDDFYVLDEGRVHVQDQRGYYVMYDTALDDLRNLEKDLILVGSFYLAKDRDLRSASAMARNMSARRKNMQQSVGDFDIPSYSHQDVDRFAVLLDLWSNETAFMECKKEVLDCYMEAYHHVFDRDEKRRLAQAMTDIIHQRPRFDFDSGYFVRSYRLECVILRHKSQLVKTILDAQIEEQREYIQKVCREGDSDFGLPHKIVPKQPISVNMSRSALRNVYMLEFHPSLATASRLPEALNHALTELCHIHKPPCIMDTLVLERKLLERCHTEWETLPVIGSCFNSQVQKDLFAEVFVEDPLFINEIAHTLVAQMEQAQQRLAPKEKQIAVVSTVGRLMETLTTRHRLIESAWESEILSKVYRIQAKEMGFDECHLFLRIVQFEFAPFKHDAGRPPPVFISAIQEDDTGVDRYIPNYLYLAIHEFDEGHVGRFSFRSRDGLLSILKQSGLESIQAVLATQIVHKNALVAAVTLADACHPTPGPGEGQLTKSGRPGSPTETKSEKSSTTVATAVSSSNMVVGTSGKRGQKQTRTPDAFVSLQLEKTPSRDLILNEFINKKSGMATTLKNPEEMEKFKRKLILEYSYRFNQRLAQYSLRSQIISYYNSILNLLEDFPNIRESYFLMGETSEKKTAQDSVKGLESDPRQLRRRPRRVLSQDGQLVLNVWFIPHHTEMLIAYKDLDDATCRRALHHQLRIVSALHDIIQYLCAHSRLGSAHARLGSKKVEFVSADWGGTEGIGADLREIQKQIDHLDDRTDPDQVCTFLTFRRDVMFLEFDTAVRCSMRDTFLATGNAPAYRAITQCMHFALDFLSNTQKEALSSLYLTVPEPMEARDSEAKVLFPWRSFLNRYGPFPVHFWQWPQIESCMQLCLAGLKDVDRHVANGEILGVSLLMEDVLTMGQYDRAVVMEDGAESTTGDVTSSARPSSQMSRAPSSRPPSSLDYGRRDRGGKKPLSRTERPIEAYKLLKGFLLLWKRLEILKINWGCHRLQVPSVDTTNLYKGFCKEYKKEVLFPVLSSVARRYGQGELYEGMVSDDEPLVVPKGASETEIKMRQLVKILEALECHMLMEIRKKIARELNLVLTERAREESALPTDLWKRPSIKESFTINKPHIADDFINKLMSDATVSNNTVTFPRQHLNSCLSTLASDVMAREKQNYESYSMYYENHLRTHHQLLYSRQQEIKQLKDQVAAAKLNVEVEVQCQLADHSQDLLLEITALRAKIAEMREKTLSQEQDLRSKISDEYYGLIHNLFNCTFDLKKRFDVHRENLHMDVMNKIEATRNKATEEMDKVQQKSGSPNDDDESVRLAKHSSDMHAVRSDNHQLSVLMTKMKVMGSWKQTHHVIQGAKQVADLTRAADRAKKQLIEMEMVSKEKIILLREQLLALRHALKLSETEAMQIKKQLETELKAKKENSHAEQQKAQSQKQLEEARKANIDKMVDELEEKEGKLRQLGEEQDKARKLNQLMNDKVKKDVSSIKKQLTHERTLKIDAFQRVDDLQTQIYDIETGILPITHRPQTAVGNRSLEPRAEPSQRPKTATGTVRVKTRMGSSKGRSSMAGGVWPPLVSWPANRSPSPAPERALSLDRSRVQRPKTTIGRLRSRIADQLLNDLDPPDHHETLVRLRELHGGSKEKVF